MKSILVIGASGLVGSRFCELAAGKNLEITGVDENTLDILDRRDVLRYFKENEGKFDTVVNFAAYTNVDQAEKERGKKGLVWNLNVIGVNNLIEACKKLNIFLVQISTDFIFPGTNMFPGPYSEATQPTNKLTNDISWYGWTKRIAEKDLILSGVNHAIVRIAYPFRSDDYKLKSDWAKILLTLYKEHKLYPFFTDQVYSILFIDDLTKPLTKIIKNKLEGVFHIVSKDTTNPYDVAKYLLIKYSGEIVNLKKGSIREFLEAEGRTPRPILGGLKTERTENALGMKFPTWKQMIDEYVKGVKNR